MTHRQADTIYAAASLVATALLGFLCVSLLLGRFSGTFNVLVLLLAAIIWGAGFALRHVATH